MEPEIVRYEHKKGVHEVSEEEANAFLEHINFVLARNKDLQDRLPLANSAAMYAACKDGLLLCHLINQAVPDTIDVRALNKPRAGKTLDVFQSTENNNVAINSATAIGCKVVNCGSQDIIDGTPHIILGLIWQIIRVGLLSQITLTAHPELYRLLLPGEDISDLLKLPPEQILLRWVNYHLKNAGSNKRINNFSGDIKDSEAYTILLNQLAPDKCNKNGLRERDLEKRAGLVLENADKLAPDSEDVVEWSKFMKPTDITGGNPKLNLAFVANLFNLCPGLEKLSEAEMDGLEDWLFNSEGSREARAFTLWLNSLGIDPYVNNLFEDLRDGLVILRAEDAIEEGSVDWKQVQQKRLNQFSKIGNLNHAVDVGLGDRFKFSLVGIQGADINSGNKTLTLALIWQLMRHHVLSILTELGGGTPIAEPEIIAWANETAAGAGKASSMQSFQDSSLKTGVFFCDLLSAIRSKAVNYEFVTPGASEEDALANAKYAISVARKLGATIFILPEDIVEVKSKMLITFVGAIMSAAKKIQAR